MKGMSSLRLAFILLLTVALDLSPLPPPHATWEVGEELEEAAHPRRSRRPLGVVRDAAGASVVPGARAAQYDAPRPPRPAFRPAPIVASIRKLPPSRSDSASAPEAH
jgi:hypothetical protein